MEKKLKKKGGNFYSRAGESEKRAAAGGEGPAMGKQKAEQRRGGVPEDLQLAPAQLRGVEALERLERQLRLATEGIEERVEAAVAERIAQIGVRVGRMEERLERAAGRMEDAAQQLQELSLQLSQGAADREQMVWEVLDAVEGRLCSLQGAVQRSGGELGASMRQAVMEIRKEVGRGKERMAVEAAAVREAVARVEGRQVEMGGRVSAAAQGAADAEAAACALGATLRGITRQLGERQQQERRLEKQLRQAAAHLL